uniref:Uncharacterized protein n=1 Tax=Phlebotomus papatasi TaxID=29031 RepID=A0A1B0DBN6_PHLPP
MPNVIGCVDCTHISIIRPLMHDTERPPRLYINRKKFYSLNVEATVDSDLIFTSVNPKFPGATHDSGIWMKSPVRNHMKKEFLRNREQHIVLGDKGYPLEPFIFTPYPTPETDNQERFNRLHEQARNTIERSFGVLKAVFRCLLKHRVLHYKPVIAGKITNACFTLYNYMRRNGYNFDQIEGVNEEFENDIALNDGELYRIGLERRETYISALVLASSNEKNSLTEFLECTQSSDSPKEHPQKMFYGFVRRFPELAALVAGNCQNTWKSKYLL